MMRSGFSSRETSSSFPPFHLISTQAIDKNKPRLNSRHKVGNAEHSQTSKLTKYGRLLANRWQILPIKAITELFLIWLVRESQRNGWTPNIEEPKPVASKRLKGKARKLAKATLINTDSTPKPPKRLMRCD